MPPHPTSADGPLRVLMTADTVGGVWTFAMELCEGLALRGVEVNLATLGPQPSSAQFREAERIPRLRLYTSTFKLEWMEDPWRDIEASRKWLLDLASQCSPTVVHLNSFGHASLPWNVPVVLTAHSCVASWWRAVHGSPIPEYWSRYTDLVAHALQSADLVTAPSQAMLQTLEQDYHFPTGSSRVRVIPNGRLPSRFYRAEKEEFILAAGRLWDCAKGIDTLATVASAVHWPVYLAGECATPDEQSFVAPACRMLGRLSARELANYYSRAPIYVLPARYEPFGLSALEAALSGCALILGDIPSLREVWQDNAVFVPPGDKAALTAAIRLLIRNSAERDDFARRAYRRAREFDSGRMTQAYLSVYSLARKERFTCVA